MAPRFNWKHLPAVLGALAFGVIVARDRFGIDPFLMVVPAMMGMVLGPLGKVLGGGVALFFAALFTGVLCWFEPFFFAHLPSVLLAMVCGGILGQGLVVRSRRAEPAAPQVPVSARS
jgi:hypothetical protein